ncbi:hypothetical protein ACFFIX_07410 [Metabacillus herbersteinensis]|uniref:Flagellar hook-length control protein-like C-terminal domain-containing protein n=1 Tax=Metabacillus herbersteinensis TaxID=283816 RepID=A0ABV6GC80_9BACI
MEQLSAIKSMFQQITSSTSLSQQPLNLRENEVIVGNVLKLFPNQKALIQVGQTKLIAQLETALTSMQSYWFVVKGHNEKQHFQLKVLKPLEAPKQSIQDSAKDLLTMFQVRPTNKNLSLVKAIVKENIPISKEQLVLATEMLKQTQKTDGIKTQEAILFSLKQNLPLTEAVIKSLKEVQTTQPLVKQINQLLTNLEGMIKPSLNDRKLTKVLQEIIQKPIEVIAANLVKAISDVGKIGQLPEKEQLLIQGISQKINNEQNTKFLPLLDFLRNTSVANNIVDTNSSGHETQIKESTTSDIKETPNPLSSNLKRDYSFFTNEESKLLFRLVGHEPSLQTGDDVKNLLMYMDDKIGSKAEYELLQHLKKDYALIETETKESLKPLLISATKENHHPPAIREQIDQLLLRLNGQTLLHQENGPTQQIITQVPIQTERLQTDLTFQWSGKKQQNGKIDPNYCRVVFYLELSSLKDIMVDVQIQNRIMSISVYNNTQSLPDLVSMQTENLKNKLKEMNYQLSAIKVKPFQEETRPSSKIQKSLFTTPTSKYIGVDIRI